MARLGLIAELLRKGIHIGVVDTFIESIVLENNEILINRKISDFEKNFEFEY